MNRAAALGLIFALPFLAGSAHFLTIIWPPLYGYAATLALYWLAVLAPLIWWQRGQQVIRLAIIWPGILPGVAMITMILGVAIAAGLAMIATPAPIWILLAVTSAAILNGALEEVFWRGTVQLDGANWPALAAVAILFAGWHIALLFANGITLTGGPLALLGGAFFAGALWTVARARTGSIGFCIVTHVALNLFAFTELAVQNSV